MLLIFSVTAFYLAIVTWCIRTDQFMADIEFSGCCFKKCGKISFTTGKAICECKTVISLNTFHFDSMFSIPSNHLLEKISRRIGVLLWIGSEKSQTGELVNRSIMEQAQVWICNTAAWNNFHVLFAFFLLDGSSVHKAWAYSLMLA